MISIACRFPLSFFKNSNYVFSGEDGLELLQRFNSMQSLEQHILRIRNGLEPNSPYWDTTEDIMNKFKARETISPEEVKALFEIPTRHLTLLEYLEDPYAKRILQDKYPGFHV